MSICLKTNAKVAYNAKHCHNFDYSTAETIHCSASIAKHRGGAAHRCRCCELLTLFVRCGDAARRHETLIGSHSLRIVMNIWLCCVAGRCVLQP